MRSSVPWTIPLPAGSFYFSCLLTSMYAGLFTAHALHICFIQTNTCSLYERATYQCPLNFIISPPMTLGRIRLSAELSPLVHCYAAPSHTWLNSPLVLLCLSTHQHLCSLSSSASTFYLHPRILVSPLPSLSNRLLPHPHLCAVALVPQEALLAGS